MGARLGGGDSDELAENSDINITPFIDVMLVLLIIFMVAAPLSTVDIPVELPVAVAEPNQRPSEPVFVTISEDLGLSIGDLAITKDQLPVEIGIATKLRRDSRIFIRADKSVPYGEFIGVMNLLRAEGYLKVGLVGLDEASAGDMPGTTPDEASTQPVTEQP